MKRKLTKVLIVILKLSKPYLQRNILGVEESTKVKSLYSIFLVKRLVILLLGVQIKKSRNRRKMIGAKARRNLKVTNPTKKRVRKIVLRLKILIIVKMK